MTTPRRTCCDSRVQNQPVTTLQKKHKGLKVTSFAFFGENKNMFIKKRLLFIDILKIIGVGCVLYWHLFYNTKDLVWFLPVYGMVHLGGIGVILFLIASGAALTYNQYNFKVTKNILTFYYKRLVRVYPAMWLTMLFIFLLMPSLLENIDYLKLLQELTGFYYYFNKDIPTINSSLWFVGLSLSYTCYTHCYSI